MTTDTDALQELAHHNELLQQQQRMEDIDNNRSERRMKARQQGGNFKPLAPGVYAGVCSILVDVGLQEGGQYKDAYKIVLGFELPKAPARDDGKPTTISQTLTNSMDKKANLRKLIENWFGRGFPTEDAAKDFDLRKLLGKKAFINVTNTERNGKTFANISGVMPLPEGTDLGTPSGEVTFYNEDMPEDKRSEAYANLPEWIRKKVDGQIRETAAQEAPAAAGATDGGDDIPF